MSTQSTIHVARFKKQAKQLQKAVSENDQQARSKVKPYFGSVESLKLTQAQLVIARSLSFSSWRQLVAKEDWLACSFCKKWQYELNKLVAGPDVYVCDECIDLCNEIIKNSN